MSLPVIGLTTYQVTSPEGTSLVELSNNYIRAVIEAGGAPVLIPPATGQEALSAIWPRLDGVLFTGGGDVEPELFGGLPHSKIDSIDPDRDRVELSLFEAVLQARLPFFGICRGIQVINVGLGGSLYTHILDQHPKAIEHAYYPNWSRSHLAHKVAVQPGSRLSSILGQTEASVNSLHHQGIDRIAQALRPVAYAPDGLIEAVEMDGHPFGLAVQWHPECLQDQDAMRQLFRAFVEAAGSKGEG